MVVPGYLLVPGTGTGYRYNNINIKYDDEKKKEKKNVISGSSICTRQK